MVASDTQDSKLHFTLFFFFFDIWYRVGDVIASGHWHTDRSKNTSEGRQKISVNF